jgi:hypothetical protein
LALMSIMLAACGGAGEPAARETAAAAAPSASASASPAAATTGHALTCTGPVSGRDTFASVERRFGEDAARETLAGPEGDDYEALVLWPGDPARRIELVARDNAGTLASATIAEGSRWTVDGIGPGTGLAALVAANGGPFRFYGFGWDYGGLVSDWRGGALGKRSDGCFLAVELAARDNIDLPASVSGDGEIPSDYPALKLLGVHVGRMTISYPD